MSAFLISQSVSIANGSKTIYLTGGVNASFVAPGTATFIVSADASYYSFNEAVSGTAADTDGNSTITLRNEWAGASIVGGKLTAFNTIEGLRDAIRRAREIADNAAALTEAFADVFTSNEPTIDINVNGVTITVTPYQYLTNQAETLITELQDAATLFEGLQTAVQQLTDDVASQQSIIDANLQASEEAATTATAAADAATIKAGEATAAASNAQGSEAAASTKAAEAELSATAAGNSEAAAEEAATTATEAATTATGAASTATTAATEASDSADSAATSADTATTKATEAATAATTATEDAALAMVKAGEASDSAAAAASSEGVATDSAELAQKWAENPLDVPVEPGMFSSKHHALKAEEWAVIAQAAAGTVTGSLSFNGDYSAAANAWPPAPENGSALYRVSAAGNPGGTALVAGDFIIYDPTLAVWIKWQRPVAITEVTGLELRLFGIESDVSNKANSTDLSNLESVVTGNSSAISSATGRLTTVEQGLDDLEQTVADLEQSTVTPAQLAYVKTLALAGL